MKPGAGTLERIAFFGLMAALVISPTQYGLEVREKTFVSPVAPMVWAVGLVWALAAIRARKINLLVPPLPVAALVGWTALSTIRAQNRIASLKDTFQLAEYFIVFYLVAASYVRAVDTRRRLVYAFLGASTVVVLVGVIQYWAGGIPDIAVSATFGNRNVLGGFLALLLPLAFGLLLFDPSRLRRCWYAALVGAGLSIVLSGGTLIALVVSMGVVAMFRGHWAFLVSGTVFLLCFILLAPSLPRDNIGVMEESVLLHTDEGGVSRRYTEWQAATVMALENPVLGVGAGNYQSNVGTYYGTLPDPTGPTEPDTQNLYLVIASSTGFVGLAAYLGMLTFFGVRATRAIFRGPDGMARGLAVGVLGSVLAFGINCIWSPLLVRGIGVPLAFLLALSGGVGSPDRADNG